MNKLGILMNCRTLDGSNSELCHQLNLLAYKSNIKVQINVTGELTSDKLNEFELTDSFKLTFQSLVGRITNANLRGRYKELNCEYVLFIDDDFMIDDVMKTIELLKQVIIYMDEHPTCSITRFRFNRGVPFSGDTIKFTYPITSTSLSCGIILRSKNEIFTNEQLDWHWKSDDYTMILNALEQGYGIEVDKHWFRHEIKSKQEDVVFDTEEILHTIPNRFDDEVMIEDGKIVYTLPANSKYSRKLPMRELLVEELRFRTGINCKTPEHEERVACNCESSIILDNITYLSETATNFEVYKGRIGGFYHLSNSEISKLDTLILAAGSFQNPELTTSGYDQQENITKYNLACLEKFLNIKTSHPDAEPFGTVIFLGSVAKDRGFPAQPYYAADKAYMYTLIQSLRKNYPNFGFHYLTIPSTKSNMCDHGVDSRSIAEHIKYLIDVKSGCQILIKTIKI